MFYDDMQVLGTSMIEEFGTTAKLQDQSGVNKGDVKVIFPVSKKEQAPNISNVGGQLMSVAKATKSVVMSASVRNEPKVGYLLVTDKEIYKITTVEAVKPGSTVVVFKLEVTT